jgi:NAD+ synthase (glutamine-hydrolysing)
MPQSIRARLVQMEVRPGRPGDNTAVMLEHIAAARDDKAELVVFPEMAIPGYLIGDEWEHVAFLRECEACAEDIRAASGGLTVLFGSVGMDWARRNEDGRVRKYNAFFAAHDRALVGPTGGPYPFAVKTLHPNYREFDDSRHFFGLRHLALEENREPASLIAPIHVKGLDLGCVLCEDAWDADYALSPLRVLQARGAGLMVNISASPFTFNKRRKRNQVFGAHAATLQCPIVYVNNVGIQNNGKTVFTFDGATAVYSSGGGVVSGPAPYETGALTLDIPLDGKTAFGDVPGRQDDGVADLYHALAYGARRFLELCGIRKVVVGVSGGIDSSVVAALFSRILPPDALLLVTMPGAFTSDMTRGLADALARNLGCLYATVPIGDSAERTRAQIDGLDARSADGRHHAVLRCSEFVMENIQARDRSARVLAAVAAAFGGAFTCNANKSEATVGYTTLYGDLGGFLASIADLWKTEVYALARYLNDAVFATDAIPPGTLKIVPSAELSPQQAIDAGRGDPLVYPYHDRLFRSWVEWWNRTTPEEILTWYADGTLAGKLEYDGDIGALFPDAASFIADVERWWGCYQGMGLAKRIQAPPVLAVKRRAFGFDHREAQMGARYTRAYAALKRRVLGGSVAAAAS